MLHEQHECDTSATRVKNFDFDNNIFSHKKVKTYFHTATFTIWQVEDYKERNNFILRANFGNALFPCQNAFEKCTTKTELLNGKSYIKNLHKIVAANALARSRIVTHSNAVSFSIKTILCENTNISFTKKY